MPFFDHITKCNDKDHIFIALIGFAVAATVAGLSFGVIGNYSEDDDQNTASKNLANFLIVGAAIAVGWNLKGGLTTFMSGGTGATKTLAMTKIAVVIGMLVVVWIGNGQLNGNNSPNVLMGISGGLASLTAIAAGVKTVACLRAHGSY